MNSYAIGWMSDYDTFPLRKIEAEVGARLGRNGKFTSFEGTCYIMDSGNAHINPIEVTLILTYRYPATQAMYHV